MECDATCTTVRKNYYTFLICLAYLPTLITDKLYHRSYQSMLNRRYLSKETR